MNKKTYIIVDLTNVETAEDVVYNYVVEKTKNNEAITYDEFMTAVKAYAMECTEFLASKFAILLESYMDHTGKILKEQENKKPGFLKKAWNKIKKIF